MSELGRAFYEQGIACEKAGDISAAFEAFRRSAKADPRVAAAYVGLSRVLLQNYQRAEAIACLERAIACEPANPSLHTLLGQALAKDGQLARSRRSYEQALRMNPEAVDATVGIASLLEDLGERTAAASAYGKLLERVPGDSNGLAGLLDVADGEVLDRAIGSAEQQLTVAGNADTALIAYSLGKALARRGDHEAAFSAWTTANDARRSDTGTFDRHRFDERIERLIAIFSAGFFAARQSWGDESRQPTFVVGLPRSGTTLTEQILASHPDVFGAGELDLLTDMATGTPDLLGRPDPPWPETALELDRTHVTAIARQHLERLRSLAGTGILRIIDKQPLNFWHLGLVALTLPKARIIHCTRDVRDNGLSIFAENFTPAQRWSTELSDIAHYWRGYRRLMHHWKSVTGLRIMDIAYEAIVSDLETQARRLTAFLDLPWDAAVLDFHASGRAVQTPSRWQVRRPLYSGSAGRWRRYERQLVPLILALTDDCTQQSE